MNSTLCGLVVLLIQVSSLQAFAALGDNESAISKEARSMKAAHTRIQNTNYSVHEISNEVGVIREYVSSNGVVFAVSWRGMSRPDLSTLLGPYHTEYAVATAQMRKPHGRHTTTVKSAHAVVRRGGHMRDIHGMAYVPQLLPASVRVEELK